MDSLLGIKRIYTTMNLNLYDRIGQYDCSSIDGLFSVPGKMKCNIYDNKNALGLGYIINYDEKRSLKQIKFKETNVFENQNILLNTMMGNDIKYFKPYKVEVINASTYKYKLNDNDMIYLYTDDTGIQKANNNWKDEEVILDMNVNGEVNISTIPLLYYLDGEALERDLKYLKKQQMKIEKVTNTYIAGTVNAKDDNKVLFTSIPYDKGCRVKVNGKKVKSKKLYNTFLGVKLKEEKHKVEFEYSIPGLKLGASISIISIVLMILYLKHEKEF